MRIWPGGNFAQLLNAYTTNFYIQGKTWRMTDLAIFSLIHYLSEIFRDFLLIQDHIKTEKLDWKFAYS